MNTGLSAAGRRLARFITLAALAAGIAFQAAAEEPQDGEFLQYERIQNKIKPASSVLTIDLPFSFDDTFVDEEIPEDMKGWISSNKSCQTTNGEPGWKEQLWLTCNYLLFSQDYVRSYITGNEKAAMKLYLQGSMVDQMKGLEENKQITGFSHRIMDIKLTGSKDTALLLKGRYREGTRDYEVWALQILHKKEIWQLVFFFDPTNEAMRDAVEAACFGAVIK